MNDFARIMTLEGVRAKDAPRPGQTAKRRPTPPPATIPAVMAPSGHATASAPTAPRYAWASGALAKRGLETAFERLAAEQRAGTRGWATGIRQDGTSMALPTASGPMALMSAADRHDLRMIVIGGTGWTFMLHPMLGVATLDDDPDGDPE